jgi:predicted transposase YbfD/YdcC
MIDTLFLVEQMRLVPDFRKPQGKRYLLCNILTIMVLAMLSGADDFEAIASFSVHKADFLIENGLLDGKNMPSHDLFRYIMMHIDKSIFSQFLVTWLENTDVKTDPDAVVFNHIDGKVLRATRTAEHTRTALLVLNAYCSNSNITIGASLEDKKSSEKKAIPRLIENLYLAGSVVTIDAIGTMTHVAAAIRDKKADYLLPLKKNNKLFYTEVDDFFRCFTDTHLVHSEIETTEINGGRTEKRTCDMITDLSFFPDAEDWKDLKTIVRITRERTKNGKTSTETVFYLTSLTWNSMALMAGIRRHWSIENQLHWHLDVAFNEDKLRLREENATHCMAMLRRFCLTLLKRYDSKESIKGRRMQLAWDNNELLKVLKSLIIK